jgi:hypothetical protein
MPSSWGSSVSVVSDYRLDDRVFDPRQSQKPLASVPWPALRPTQPPVQWAQGFLRRRKERPGRDADQSPPSSAEVKNE